MKPPFDDKFFSELISTIRDFMKIGKKTFCYDFKNVDQIDALAARNFEEIIPLFRAGKCNLKILNASEGIFNQLPEHKKFTTTSKRELLRPLNFTLKIDVDTARKEAMAELDGEFIEQETLEEFKSKTSQLIEKVKLIILDFRKLVHISTIAVGGLIFLKVHCDRDNVKVVICNASSGIKATLEMSGILHIIPTFNSIEEARAWAEKS
jgi:anti-anti-sigma factor